MELRCPADNRDRAATSVSRDSTDDSVESAGAMSVYRVPWRPVSQKPRSRNLRPLRRTTAIRNAMRSDVPRAALADLGLTRLDVIHAGTETFPLAPKVRAVSAGRILTDLKRLVPGRG